MIRFYGKELLAPNPQTGGLPLVGCPRLLIQYIRSCPPYWRPFLHPQPEDAPCRGDRDPLITGVLRLCSNFRYVTSVFLWVFPKQAFSYDAPFSVKSIHCAYFSKWGWGVPGSVFHRSLCVCVCVCVCVC